MPGYFNRVAREGRRTRIRATTPFLDWMLHKGLIFPWHPYSSKAEPQAKHSKSLLWLSETGVGEASKLVRNLQGDECILPPLNDALKRQKIEVQLTSY